MGNFIVWVIWVIAAAACIGTALRVVTSTSPFSSALSLIGNLASLAVLYLLASGEFVAAAQVLVYAGAVMVMFLFVIAYLGGRADAPFAEEHRGYQLASVGASVALLAVTLVALAQRRRRAALGRGRDHPRIREPARDGPALPHRPPARLRDHLDRAAHRGGRRRDPRDQVGGRDRADTDETSVVGSGA